MKIFHDKTPNGPKTSRMVQDKGGTKPAVSVAGWVVILICAAAAIAAVVKVGG